MPDIFSMWEEARLRMSETAGAGSAEVKSERAVEAVRAMQADVERLLMICEAMWTILKEQHGYGDEELFRRIMEIDLRDGRADGKVAPSGPALCPTCRHPVSKKRPICLYCGKPMMVDPFAR